MPLVTPRIGCEATTGTAFDGKPYRERITGAGDSVGVLPVSTAGGVPIAVEIAAPLPVIQ